MPAPKGNKYWELRSKDGSDKIFATPESIWTYAEEYFKWSDNNIWHINEQLKQKPIIPKDSKLTAKEIKELINPIVKIPTVSPYSISGFCLYVGIDFQTFLNYETKEGYEEYFEIMARIRNIIETQQFDGATVGVFNPNIIARKLGLVDKKDHGSSDGTMTPKSSIVVVDKEAQKELEDLEDAND